MLRRVAVVAAVLLAASAAVGRASGLAEGGGVCGQPWQYDKEYVPDEASDPEGYKMWLNDLTSTGFQPLIGVKINAESSVDDDALWSGGGGLNSTAAGMPHDNLTTAAPTAEDGSTNSTDITTGLESVESTPAPTVSPTEAPTQGPTEAPTEAPTPAPTVSPFTEQRGCLDSDGVEDEGRVYLGSDWTGTNTQKKKVTKFREFVEEVYDEIDVVWLGDSILENWYEMSEDTFKALHKPFKGRVANLGISGIEADFGLYGLWEWLSEARLYPKVWVIQIGVNDCFQAERDSPNEIFRNIRDIVRLIRRLNCQSGIIISAILPAGDYKEDWSWKKSPHRECITETNEKMKQWLDHKNFNPNDVQYINCEDYFLSDNGENIPEKLSYDAVHPTQKGYQKLAPCYKGALEMFANRKIASANADGATNWQAELESIVSFPPTPEAPGSEWMYSKWENCSARCGLGYQSRSADCIDVSTGMYTSGCEAELHKAITRPCFLGNCPEYSWRSGPWSDCSSSCGGGAIARDVTCVTDSGLSVDDSNCRDLIKPATTRECNLGACGVCGPSGDCSGHGTCTTEGCECQAGWRGSLCEVEPSCDGSASTAGCCSSGIVTPSGACCPFDSVVDSSGECCGATEVDACGVCSGRGKTVDIHGACCTGTLDARGLCCAFTESVDACGVCGGANTTCGVAVTAAVSATSLTSLQVYLDSYMPDTLKALASPSGLSVSNVEAQSMSLKDFSAVYSSSGESVQADVRVLMVPESSSTSLAELMTLLHGLNLPQSPSQRLLGLSDATPSGVCGNGVCETGEMWLLADPSQGHAPDGLCLRDCVADLAAPPKGCASQTALGSSGPLAVVCSGHGTCISSTGYCDCRTGYSGAACSVCEAGYQMVGTRPLSACVPSASLGIALTSQPPGPLSSPVAVGLFSALMVALVLVSAAMLYTLCRWQGSAKGSEDVAKAPLAQLKLEHKAAEGTASTPRKCNFQFDTCATEDSVDPTPV